MPISAGQDLLHYRLIEKIGEGGMGVVWKALDTSLDREVAIKILPEEVAANEQRLARFEREAKLLASLNHPNVATVYGVHNVDGKPFLAMELIPGEDLAERLQRGRLPLDQAMGIAGRIVEGLEAAHAQGVIHRDLKPANIRVTAEGVVKILDFGLAKVLTSESDPGHDPSLSPTMTSTGTVAGMLLGTATYMSPEQARGQEADARSDVWAFGCVLWECLTGEMLFGRSTVSDSLAAILTQEPDWNRLPSGTPPNVVRLLRRSLNKDARARLHHIADARIELEDTEADPTASESSPHGYRILAGMLALALLAALAILAPWWPWSPAGSSTSPANPLADASFTRVTDFKGSEYDASISRDGRFVTFISDRDGPFDVFVSQIGTNVFRNLTNHSVQVNYVREVRRTGFNADGSEIWLGGGVGRRMRSIPLLGGPLRNFLGDDAVNVDWSPDGRRMVYHDKTPGDPIFVADRDGANPIEILAPPAGHQHFPTWSVDGQWIYMARGRPATLEMDLWRVRPDGSDLERLTEDKLLVQYPTPLDERTVLFTAREKDGAGPWLWMLDLKTRVTRRVTIGLERYNSIAISADRRRLVATVENPQAELWSVPILDRTATDRDCEPFEGTAGLKAQAPRFGGSSLFFLSSLGSGDGLYRLHEGEITEIWRGAETPLLEPPAISPDGVWLVLLLRHDEAWHLRRVSADGAVHNRLTGRVDARGSAAWSPDGRWVVTGGSVDGAQGLFKIPVDGGEPQRIVAGEALNPEWSPDGELIVYSGKQVAAIAPLEAVDPEGNPIELPDIEVWRGGERYRFLPDGSALIIMQGRKPAQDFEMLDLETMKRRVLTRFGQNATMRTFDITPDGKRIVFDRLREDSDIVLIELDSE